MEAKVLRRIARDNLSGNWLKSIGVAFIAALLGGMLLGTSFLPEVTLHLKDQDIQDLTQLLNLIEAQVFTLSFGLGSALGLAQFIMGGAVELGYTRYLLNQYNRADFEFSDLTSQFHRFGQGFAQRFLRNLYVALWSLLFVIPGIVKSYAYAMTPYIMAENPELTASQAITASKQMMEGHKSELFVLDLTFIGWNLLCMLTLDLGHIVLNPYKNAARTAFYKELTRQGVIYE